MWNDVYWDGIGYVSITDRAWNLGLLIHIKADAGKEALHLEAILTGTCGFQDDYGWEGRDDGAAPSLRWVGQKARHALTQSVIQN